MERDTLAIHDWLIGPECPAIHRRECVTLIWPKRMDLPERRSTSAMCLPSGNRVEPPPSYAFDTRDNALRCISTAENPWRST
jgi:hypothetical protein